MTAPLTLSRSAPGAPGAALVRDAVAEHCSIAGRYATAAANLAAAGDDAGMAHALGCAARTIMAAVEATQSLRASNSGRRA